MKHCVCVSGPHGGGKTYLIDKLLTDDRFTDPAVDIDFLSEFGSFRALEDWERSLLRLYHRIVMPQLIEPVPGRCVLVSRGAADSEAYIEAYARLGWISGDQHKRLRQIIDHLPAQPPTLLLLPDLDLNQQRLDGRIAQRVRGDRDTVFRREDQPEFLTTLHQAFAELADRPGVLTIHDNQPAQITEVIDWILESEGHA
ncbi:hypothetical protein [Nocardia terpenica]|uniref:Deoxynucleoside kinase domain-containing protein n=1 Tax=Nocardia terpenica TaxID=455432 RepID=A0A291RY61_9NOCA|nr:hypothetical protein [Nocardia terpenica]ATL72521.1 hypothetical protein CRH09_39820 [Nocardia terpenica]